MQANLNRQIAARLGTLVLGTWLSLLGLVTVFSLCAPAAELLPLDSPQFQNGWPETDERWQMVAELYRQGELERLEGLLTELTYSDHSRRLLALRNLAVVQKDLGQLQRALESYGLAIMVDGSEVRLWQDLGWVCYSLARYADAAQAFEWAAALSPSDPRSLLGLGMALARHAPDRALSALTAATELDSGYAAAFYELGFLLDRLGRKTEAMAALERAVKLDGAYTGVWPYLARAYEEQGDRMRAWNAYQKAVGTRPRDSELQADLARFVARNEDVLREAELAGAVDRASVRLRRVEPMVESGAPAVRVGLVENANSLKLAWGAPVEVRRLGQVVTRLRPGGIWTLSKTGKVLSLRSHDGEVIVSGAAPWELVPTDPTSTIAVYDMEMGKGYFYARREHRQYRGHMELLLGDGGITLVNVVDLESYLLSVVPSEMYARMPLEALKVQAVAARTYTLRSLGRYKTRGFDVLGSVASSEYRGAGVEHPNTTAAVLATTGMVLRDGSRLAEVYYSATAGGHTVSSQEMWGGGRDYLNGLLDAKTQTPLSFPLGPAALEAWIKEMPQVFAAQSSFTTRSSFRWELVVPAGEIEARVNASKPVGQLTGIVARKRALGGQVLEVEVIGNKGTYLVKGDRIRSTLGGLKSNLFKVEVRLGPTGLPESFVFFGGGFGHGVGMDQLGTAAMAEQGYDMAAIIRHYLGPVQLVKEY